MYVGETMTGNKPYVWQMIKEAVENLGKEATYGQIKSYIKDKYGDVNENTISAQINLCTVNSPSRVHYADNQKPRVANSMFDFLFKVRPGQVELYDPQKHGIWEISTDEFGKLQVVQSEQEPPISDISDEEPELWFPLESHLRDFLAKNIQTIHLENRNLQLYTDENGREGVEYPTAVGPIDILAVDNDGGYVIFELKLGRGEDKALGQLLRYMGWVKSVLANGKAVRGVIVAKSIGDKLKYAVSITPEIVVFEYELNFKIQQVSL